MYLLCKKEDLVLTDPSGNSPEIPEVVDVVTGQGEDPTASQSSPEFKDYVLVDINETSSIVTVYPRISVTPPTNGGLLISGEGSSGLRLSSIGIYLVPMVKMSLGSVEVKKGRVIPSAYIGDYDYDCYDGGLK